MLHYKTRDKKFRKAEFYKEISHKYRFVIYKIQIGHYYYIGVTHSLSKRIALHKVSIRKSALAIASGGDTSKIKTPYLVFGNVLARNIKNIDKYLYDMKIEILHGVRVMRQEYAYEIEYKFINKHINDWRCLNISTKYKKKPLLAGMMFKPRKRRALA